MRFPKAYLEQVVETQGELFDAFAARYPRHSTEDFIVAYLNSRTRAEIDQGQAYVCTMEADDLLSRFLSEGYSPSSGEAFRGFVPDWIGRFYALGQWMLNETSAGMAVRFPPSYLKNAYPGLHDLELDLAVRKAAGEAPLESLSVAEPAAPYRA